MSYLQYFALLSQVWIEKARVTITPKRMFKKLGIQKIRAGQHLHRRII
jgi:hypothetical protein